MPEEHEEKATIAAAIASTDWARYAGPATAVKRRGESRRHRLQAGAALGTTFAVVGVAIAVTGVGRGPATRQGAASTSAPTSSAPNSPAPTSSSQTTWPSASPPPSKGSPAPETYPSFPATLPTTPKFAPDPGKILQSGVIGAGSVSGHQWQLSYRVIPSGSAANSKPQVSMVDVSLDGKTINGGVTEGTAVGSSGYLALDPQFGAVGVADPMIVAYGTPSPGVTSVDLRWKNGTVVQVPIHTVTGTRIASFAWDPANPPYALEQVRSSGVQQITITHDAMGDWDYDKLPSPIHPATPPTVTTPTGTPNLSQTPKVTPISSGILGEGKVAGHQWQFAYEIVPSGSVANSSNEVFCTDSTVDGTTWQNGCTSKKPFGSPGFLFTYMGPHAQFPFVIDDGGGQPGTTSVGFEWPDGTKTATAVTMVEGVPMASLAFDQNKPPAYLLEYGSYGEYRIPLTAHLGYSWTFNW